MTADDGGGSFAEDEVFYNNFWANFCQFSVLLLNLDESESEFQKYVNHKFS